MREDEVRKTLIEYLKKNKIEFVEEVNLGGCKIDFLIKNYNNWFGVEVKGDRADEILALGQLLNYYRFISHVILCAPKKFIKKIKNLILSNPELIYISKKLGTITIDTSEIAFIKPQNSTYYFSIRKTRKKEERHSKFPKYDRPDETDIAIIELVKSKGRVLLGEIIKSMSLSYENARKRIMNLERFGYLKVLSRYPILVSIGDRDEKRAPCNKV